MTGLLVGGAVLTAAPAQADTRTERYIVSTFTAEGADQALTKVSRKGARASHRYNRVLNGFSAQLTSAQLSTLRNDSRVKSVTVDHVMTADSTQTDSPWGLDRLNQRSKTLDGRYTYLANGAGVTVFEIDTGIQLTHDEFGGRAVSGYDFVGRDTVATDCNGHGTHVAGTIAGSTYGVAKQATVVALRALDCDGDGRESDFIKALQWVVDHKPAGPAVVNISAGSEERSQPLDDAVAAVIKTGLPVVVAAGNDQMNACETSPARTKDAITVAASTESDARASYSNYGSCVDLFAPGSDILSSVIDDVSNSEAAYYSGTSMAAPHVAGALARYLEAYPKASPAAARSALIGDATSGAIAGENGSPDKLLYLRGSTTGAATKVDATHSDPAASITLKWSPPYGFGAPTVTGYRVSRNGTFTPVDLPASARSFTFPELKHGGTYDVSVTPLNAAGAGSVATQTEKLLSLPGTGRVSSPSAGSTSDSAISITARWQAPSSGGAVASYAIEVRKSGATAVKTATASSSRRSLAVTKLTKNSSYVVRVRAVNAAGAGAWSSWSSKATAR